MDLVRDILDERLLDRNRCRMGRVDGLLIEQRDGQPPILRYIEVGSSTLAARMPRVAGALMNWCARRWGPRRGEPCRLPWALVFAVDRDIHLDVEAEETPALASEQWVREGIITRLPLG